MPPAQINGLRVIQQIQRSVKLAEELGRKMEPVLQEAQRTAPDADAGAPGYKEGLTLDWGINPQGKAYARVIGMAYNSAWVEFGAHAGGKTFVLNYRILGNALIRVR